MCVNPFTIVVESRASHKKRSINVPCGKCSVCLKQRQNDWKLRICKEAESWSHVYFFTLTYRDSMLPCNLCYEDVFDEVLFHGTKPMCELQQKIAYPGTQLYSTVDFDDVRRWLKRFRTNYERSHGCKWNVKYFICSEYGPNPRGTKRPHYHGIFMTDLTYHDLLPMFNEWSEVYGRIQFDECGITREDKSSVANYISKYCSKGCFESRLDDINYKRITRAYSCMSKNIGLAWIESHSHDWLKYVPSYLSVKGDWDIDMVEEFFVSMRQSSEEDYARWMLELDNLLLNLCIYDGDSFKYKIPRYFYNYLFGKKIFEYKPKLISNHGKPIPDIKSFLQSFREDSFCFETDAHFVFYESPQQITYVSKMAKISRFVSSTFLSSAIAYRLRDKLLARFESDFRRLLDEGVSDIEALRILQVRESSSKSARMSSSEAQLCSFYQSNMWKNRILDFDADSFDNQLFTNF